MEHRTTRITWLLMAVSLPLAVGCDDAADKAVEARLRSKTPPPVVAPADNSAPAPAANTEKPAATQPGAQAAAPGDASEPGDAAQPAPPKAQGVRSERDIVKNHEEPDEEREVATTGVGRKGRGYGGGIITEPIRAKFRTEQRIVFEIQIPEAVKLYKAEHNNKGPKTHEQYMRDIIEANSISLPELPDGESYVYDPAREELMVARKK